MDSTTYDLILIGVCVVMSVLWLIWYVATWKGAKTQRELVKIALMSEEEKKKYREAKEYKAKSASDNAAVWVLIFVAFIVIVIFVVVPVLSGYYN